MTLQEIADLLEKGNAVTIKEEYGDYDNWTELKVVNLKLDLSESKYLAHCKQWRMMLEISFMKDNGSIDKCYDIIYAKDLKELMLEKRDVVSIESLK